MMEKGNKEVFSQGMLYQEVKNLKEQVISMKDKVEKADDLHIHFNYMKTGYDKMVTAIDGLADVVRNLNEKSFPSYKEATNKRCDTTEKFCNELNTKIDTSVKEIKDSMSLAKTIKNIGAWLIASGAVYTLLIWFQTASTSKQEVIKQTIQSLNP